MSRSFYPRSTAAPQPLVLTGGRVIDPANGIDGVRDILVRDGRIAELGPEGSLAGAADARRLDCAGCWVTPGLIDMHVHLREPGQEYKETVASGARAAVAGGFSAVACMPNTMPVNDCEAVTAFILEKARAAGLARVYPVGAISRGLKGEALADIGEMRRAGIVAVTDDGRPVMNSQLMRRALEYSANYDLPILCHSEDLSLAAGGVMNEGALSTRLGLRGIPSIAEDILVYRDIALARYLGRFVHIAHVSTAESVELIRRAKAQGVRVSAETAPHYFTLTEEAVAQYDTRAKMNPPLRTAEDVAAIRQGLADGTLDAIATDHAPHSVLEKEVEFDLAANGVIGLETALPLTLALVREGLLSPSRLVELLAVAPARILGVAGGSLRVGAAADITVIDPAREMLYREDAIVSKSKNSPFIDARLQGLAVCTLVDGHLVFDGRQPAA